MTPLEALNEATNIEYGPYILAKLRALGFAIVPVEADEATIERMARAMKPISWTGPPHERDIGGMYARKWSIEDARAAYAAITAPSDSETKK